ncbi:MAG: serpin family protein [Ruminococcus sp.]|nr:serpin family protein [Ruminococcus sp.]
MIKKFISAVIAITMVMGMCSCSEQSSGSEPQPGSQIVQPSEPKPTQQPSEFKLTKDMLNPTADYQFVAASDVSSDEKFLIGANEFSVNLFKTSVARDLADGKNTLVSPESVLFALGMTQSGAKGETLKQMQKVLCGDLDTETFNKNMNKLMTSASKSSDFKFGIANSVWVRDMQDMTLTEQFAKNCKQMYNAELFKAPFNDETLKQMNRWVNDKTDSMIPEIIEEFGADTAAVLLNCIAFDAEWKEGYEKSDLNENGEFTLKSGEKAKCTMMSSLEDHYIRDDNAEGFIKRYKGGKYGFMAILPDEGVNLADYVRSLTAEKFSRLYSSSGEYGFINAVIPKFKYDYSSSLNDAMKQMGITDAFDADKADFSGMTDGQKMYISKVAHKTVIDVNENGTKAAAATEVGMDVSGALPMPEHTVSLNRPFAYAIVELETGMPVFMGTVCNPNA